MQRHKTVHKVAKPTIKQLPTRQQLATTFERDKLTRVFKRIKHMTYVLGSTLLLAAHSHAEAGRVEAAHAETSSQVTAKNLADTMMLATTAEIKQKYTHVHLDDEKMSCLLSNNDKIVSDIQEHLEKKMLPEMLTESDQFYASALGRKFVAFDNREYYKTLGLPNPIGYRITKEHFSSHELETKRAFNESKRGQVFKNLKKDPIFVSLVRTNMTIKIAECGVR